MFIPSYKKPSSGGGGYTPPSWSDGTDEEIVEALEKHYAGEIDLHDYWSVGDERIVSLSAMSQGAVGEIHSAQNIVLVLTQIGGKILSDGVTECCFQVDQKNILSEAGYIDGTPYSIPYWNTCQRRTWCNATYKNAFPSTFVSIFKEFVNQSGKNASTTVSTKDYFALRSEIEVLGTSSESYSGEGTQVDWYKTSANRIKKYKDSDNEEWAVSWWLRSKAKNYYSNYCLINESGSINTMGYTNNKYIAPFGVI